MSTQERILYATINQPEKEAVIRRIDNTQDQFDGAVTYEFDDGRRIKLCARAVKEFGLREVLRHAGYEHEIPTERKSVFQYGKKIGTVPGDFDPMLIKTQSFFYDARPGDFKLEDDVWIACRTLCPGDFEAIPGFVWDRE